jgi:hypothetical protein
MSATEAPPIGAFDRVWRGSGIAFVVTLVISSAIYGRQPDIGASANALVSFYDGDRTRILVASSLLGLALLNLLWCAAALASTLRDARQGIWGAAATASSAALGTIIFVHIALGATLAYSIAGSGTDALTSGLNDLARVSIVVGSFPAAMLIMAGTFGLRQARIDRTARSRRGSPPWCSSFSVVRRGRTTECGHQTVPTRGSSRRPSPSCGSRSSAGCSTSVRPPLSRCRRPPDSPASVTSWRNPPAALVLSPNSEECER